MIPIRLKISGFLSYYEKVELDFTKFDVACISGANGAGKSSILDAITWSLFGQARRRDDTVLNSRAKSAEVVFDFDYENSVYRVLRSKPRDKSTLLEFSIQGNDGRWRPLTEHSLKETESKIQDLLHLDYETFTNASFFLQGKADQFSQQKPGDRKRILGSILGLETWEQFRERAAARRRLAENELSNLDGQLSEIEAELAKEDERVALLNSLKLDLEKMTALREEKEKSFSQVKLFAASIDEQKKMVASLSGRLNTSMSRLNEKSNKLQQRLEEQKSYNDRLTRADEIQSFYQQWQVDVLDLQKWDVIAGNFRQYDTQRSAPLIAIEKERARLEEEQRGLSEQEKQVGDWQAQLPGLERQLQGARSDLDNIVGALQQGEGLALALQLLQDELAQTTAENTHLREQMDDLKDRIDQLKDASTAECPLCGQPLNQVDREKLVKDLAEEGTKKGDRHRANALLQKEREQKREDLKKQLNGLERLRSLQIQQQRVVDQISEKINQITQSVVVWQDGGAKRQSGLQAILQGNNYALEARQDILLIDNALKEIGYDAAAHELIRRKENEGRSSESELRALENARTALAHLDREIADLQAGVEQDRAEVQVAGDLHKQALEKLNLDIQNLPDLKKSEAELYTVQEEENRLRMRIGGARQAVDVIKTQRQRKITLGEKRQETTRNISQIKILERAFSKDGVPALLIEQALPEIEARANEILEQLTYGGMSVRFSTQKDYKDKNREDKKETLDIVISDAAGSREYELFSGGEAFRVNFAIRLALSRYLSQRAGARLQTLVIDEGLGSQDTDGRQRLLQAINLVQHDFKKVLVITHLEELKDAFPVRIEVEKKTSGSSFRVVA